MLELKAAGAPISWGVSELATWDYRMAPGTWSRRASVGLA